ncbi:MAG: hypothetical protein RSD17_06890, partial [Oscillospiraceae bacterium]
MNKKIIVALVAIVLLFSACNKDKDKGDESIKTFDPTAQLAQGNMNDGSDTWWKQYTTKEGQKPATAQNSASNQPAKGTTSKGQSSNQAKPGQQNTTEPRPNNNTPAPAYNRVDQYTMTYTNGSNSETKLTRNPNDKFIKKTIELLSSDFSESASAAQMMCSTDSSQSGAIIYVFTSSSSKSASTAQYVLCLNDDLSASPFIKSNANKNFNFFPYADGGNANYTSYREAFKTVMDSDTAHPNLFGTLKEQFSSPF